MHAVTVFGAVAVTAMLIFYALENRASYFVLAFAVACLASSLYGFLQGAWPFVIVNRKVDRLAHRKVDHPR